MKNKILLLALFLASGMAIFSSCYDLPEEDSVVVSTSLPYIADQFVEDSYVYGFGNTTIYDDIPDVVGIAVDSVVGFEGGYGGLTGFDTVQILKSDIVAWPDTVDIGGYTITFQKFNRANYKALLSSNIVIAGMVPNPGPTAIEGDYLREATGVIVPITKVFDGVYVISNPGGAGVPPFPYLLYNLESSTGVDSLAFPIQPNPCGGGLQLVGPTAPGSLSTAEYSQAYPPIIASTSPFTLQWRIYEFPTSSPTAIHPGVALCQWGLAVRTLVKQ